MEMSDPIYFVVLQARRGFTRPSTTTICRATNIP